MEEVTAGVYLVSISRSRYSAVYGGGHAKTAWAAGRTGCPKLVWPGAWGHGGRGCCTPCSGTRPRPTHLRPAALCTSPASLPRVCARPCVVRRRGWVVCRACPACWCTIRRGNRRVWVCMGQLLCLASAVLLCVRGACACELCDFWWLERIYA